MGFQVTGMIARHFYGWYDPRRGYLVSRDPPDSPVRPAIAFETSDEATAMIKRKRAVILWYPPLRENQHADQR